MSLAAHFQCHIFATRNSAAHRHQQFFFSSEGFLERPVSAFISGEAVFCYMVGNEST